MRSTYLILTDITSNQATVDLVSNDAHDLTEMLMENELLRMATLLPDLGLYYPVVGDRIYLDSIDIIADPMAEIWG